MTEPTEVVDAQLVQVVAQFPPRADAIITLIGSDDELPGAQTLLYSIQKSLDKNILYPPELVVMATPDVSQRVRNELWPAFCTRILDVERIALPPGINSKISQKCKSWDNHCPGLTKLHAFRMEVYDTIVFVEPDCLVVDDLYPLIKRGKVYTETEALVAAAPDLFPPDKFNSGVMVIRPSEEAFTSMMRQRSLLTNYDGSDTGFLNAYYPNWHTEFPPLARLPFTYNAQRALYDVTHENQPNYWDVAISPDLKIIHYSGTPKPWEGKPKEDSSLQTKRTGDYLTDLWRQWHRKSQNYLVRFHQDKKREESFKASHNIRRKQQEQREKAAIHQDPKQIHKLVTKRYKEFRKEGYDAKEAMAMARAEYGVDDTEEPADVGAQVACMFGVML